MRKAQLEKPVFPKEKKILEQARHQAPTPTRKKKERGAGKNMRGAKADARGAKPGAPKATCEKHVLRACPRRSRAFEWPQALMNFQSASGVRKFIFSLHGPRPPPILPRRQRHARTARHCAQSRKSPSRAAAGHPGTTGAPAPGAPRLFRRNIRTRRGRGSLAAMQAWRPARARRSPRAPQDLPLATPGPSEENNGIL